MDIKRLEDRVQAANKKINRAAELQGLFDLMEKKFAEQNDTINSVTYLLESLLDNIDNTTVLDNATQRVEALIQSRSDHRILRPTVLINTPEPAEDPAPQEAAPQADEATPWYDGDKG